jgi:hypothetical protein
MMQRSHEKFIASSCLYFRSTKNGQSAEMEEFEEKRNKLHQNLSISNGIFSQQDVDKKKTLTNFR